jgi:hypothetical protein
VCKGCLFKHNGCHLRCKGCLFRRVGSKPAAVSVELEVDWQPERFTLSDGLAIMLGIQNDTRENILKV